MVCDGTVKKDTPRLFEYVDHTIIHTCSMHVFSINAFFFFLRVHARSIAFFLKQQQYVPHISLKRHPAFYDVYTIHTNTKCR
jgi:hypothetical protein